MLGADGVLVGTRFYATQEAAAFAAAKERIVAASGDETIRGILFDIARRNVWPAPYTGRVLRNGFSERWRGREAELLQQQAEEAARYDAARAAGDFDTAAVIAGEAVDMIGDIPPAGEIVERVAAEAEALLAGGVKSVSDCAVITGCWRTRLSFTTGRSMMTTQRRAITPCGSALSAPERWGRRSRAA